MQIKSFDLQLISSYLFPCFALYCNDFFIMYIIKCLVLLCQWCQTITSFLMSSHATHKQALQNGRTCMPKNYKQERVVSIEPFYCVVNAHKNPNQVAGDGKNCKTKPKTLYPFSSIGWHGAVLFPGLRTPNNQCHACFKNLLLLEMLHSGSQTVHVANIFYNNMKSNNNLIPIGTSIQISNPT